MHLAPGWPLRRQDFSFGFGQFHQHARSLDPDGPGCSRRMSASVKAMRVVVHPTRPANLPAPFFDRLHGGRIATAISEKPEISASERH